MAHGRPGVSHPKTYLQCLSEPKGRLPLQVRPVGQSELDVQAIDPKSNGCQYHHSMNQTRVAATLAQGIPLLLLWLCGPATAGAYVRSTTSRAGVPIRWHDTSCIQMRINSHGSSKITDRSDLIAARRAMDNWRNAVKHCSYIRFNIQPDRPNAVPELKECGINENVIYFEESSWSYAPEALAITRVQYIDDPGHQQDGRILDADILLNGVDVPFTTSSSPGHDIENTLTHELGHLLGLDHPCDDGQSRSKRPIQNHNGVTLPACGSKGVTQEMKDSTMYNEAPMGQTSKRSPLGDDIKGICAIYPLAQDPNRCEPLMLDRDCGCACDVHRRLPSPLPLPLLLLLVWGAVAVLRRDR